MVLVIQFPATNDQYESVCIPLLLHILSYVIASGLVVNEPMMILRLQLF